MQRPAGRLCSGTRMGVHCWRQGEYAPLKSMVGDQPPAGWARRPLGGQVAQRSVHLLRPWGSSSLPPTIQHHPPRRPSAAPAAIPPSAPFCQSFLPRTASAAHCAWEQGRESGFPGAGGAPFPPVACKYQLGDPVVIAGKTFFVQEGPPRRLPLQGPCYASPAAGAQHSAAQHA